MNHFHTAKLTLIIVINSSFNLTQKVTLLVILQTFKCEKLKIKDFIGNIDHDVCQGKDAIEYGAEMRLLRPLL